MINSCIVTVSLSAQAPPLRTPWGRMTAQPSWFISPATRDLFRLSGRQDGESDLACGLSGLKGDVPIPPSNKVVPILFIPRTCCWCCCQPSPHWAWWHRIRGDCHYLPAPCCSSDSRGDVLDAGGVGNQRAKVRDEQVCRASLLSAEVAFPSLNFGFASC